MASSCHIGLTDCNNRNRYRMWTNQSNSPCLWRLTKFLTFFKSREIITYWDLNSISFNNNFNGNFMRFMREKVNKMASKAKILNICALESNWKWIHYDLILRRKKWFQLCNSKFWSTLVVLIHHLHHLQFFHQLLV